MVDDCFVSFHLYYFLVFRGQICMKCDDQYTLISRNFSAAGLITEHALVISYITNHDFMIMR